MLDTLLTWLQSDPRSAAGVKQDVGTCAANMYKGLAPSM